MDAYLGMTIGGVIGGSIAWVIQSKRIAVMVRKIIALEGPSPEGQLAIVREQMLFADSLKDREAGKEQMNYWSEELKTLYQSGRIAWTEWDKRGLVNSIQSNLNISREQLAIN